METRWAFGVVGARSGGSAGEELPDGGLDLAIVDGPPEGWRWRGGKGAAAAGSAEAGHRPIAALAAEAVARVLVAD